MTLRVDVRYTNCWQQIYNRNKRVYVYINRINTRYRRFILTTSYYSIAITIIIKNRNKDLFKFSISTSVESN